MPFRKIVFLEDTFSTKDCHLRAWAGLDYEFIKLGFTTYIHLDKFDEYKACDSGDIMFLICHVTSHDIFKGLCKFKDGSPSR